MAELLAKFMFLSHTQGVHDAKQKRGLEQQQEVQGDAAKDGDSHETASCRVLYCHFEVS